MGAGRRQTTDLLAGLALHWKLTDLPTDLLAGLLTDLLADLLETKPPRGQLGNLRGRSQGRRLA